ncbi:pseudouridine synthase [Candidatus Margulisiibacteriota bacterium]
MTTSERLQKYLARSGVNSRRKCEQLIEDGKVSVNGQIVTGRGVKINPAADKVMVNGKKILPPAKLIYLILNKPKDYMSTKSDPRQRKTVYELLPDNLARQVFSIGRLDRNTTGLLLFTNDGDFANRLNQPKNKIPKTYLVTIPGILRPADLQILQNGVQLGSRITRPANACILEKKPGQTRVLLEITEGMNRQVRKMFASLGYEVVKLKRTAIGSLTLGSLPLGKYRYLTKKEIRVLIEYGNSIQRPGK